MKKLLLALPFVLLSNFALAANTSLSNLTAGASVAGTDLFYDVKTPGSGGVKITGVQLAAYLYGLMSGDATASGTGAITFATVNANVGSFGSATQCTTFTTNAKGLITAASQITCTPAIASVTGLGIGVATALAIAPGTTGSFTTQNGAITTGNCLKWGPGVQDAGSACGSGAVSSVTGGIGITVSPTTGAVVVSSPVTTRNTTTTTDTITSSDKGTVVTESNASAVAVAITTAGFASSDYFTVKNKGVGLATYTPSSGTIDGAATLACKTNQSADVYFDGTNYFTLGNTCGQAIVIATGTAVLGTSAIASGACATVVTVSATGVATTDTMMFGYNSDPSAVTGYGASATGAVLTIYPYPTANNANAKVCNSTASSITPSAMTLNFKVVR